MKVDRTVLIGLALAGSLLAVGGAKLMADDDDQGGGGVSLEREMKAMSQSFKIVRKQVSDPSKNDSTIKAVLDMEQHTLVAKGAIPDSATTMPSAAENAAKLGDYQGMMLNVLRQELDLEEQLRAGKNDKAAETVASLRGLENDGHAEFRKRND